MIGAIALRIALVLGRGQYFWLDESHRFHPCLRIVSELQSGRIRGALDVIAPNHLHTGFMFPGTVVAAIYIAISGYSSYQTLWIPAVILSLASVAIIALVYGIARRAGADPVEALIAAFLMACSNVMFYYARHLLPYDTSLMLSLLALWIALAPASSLPRTLLVGVLCGSAFLVYYGYLTTALVVGAIHVLADKRPLTIVTRALTMAIGFAIPVLALHALTLAWGVKPFIQDVAAIMQLATQGSYAEGWRVVWAYLWYAEHGLLLVWAMGAVLVVALAARGNPGPRTRGLLWLGAATAIYALLTVNSTVLHKSVVLGRFARQLVPFLCLATACAVRALPIPRRALALAVLLITVQAGFNFAAPLRQWFPADLDLEARRLTDGNVARDMTIGGPQWNRAVDRPARYVLLNTVTFPYPPKQPIPPSAAGATIIAAAHPVEFFPYQYEVYSVEERAIIRGADMTMRLIDTAALP